MNSRNRNAIMFAKEDRKAGDDMAETVLSINEIKMNLTPVFQKFGVKRAILFGSYCKGTARIKSDVDLLVDSGLKGLHFVGLIEAVRSALGGKEIDLFDVSHIENDSLIDREIKKTGVQIYSKTVE